MFRSAPVQRPAPETQRSPDKAADKQRASDASAPASDPRAARSWDSDENNAPISAEDRATFR